MKAAFKDTGERLRLSQGLYLFDGQYHYTTQQNICHYG
jgi:hypothetical protein